MERTVVVASGGLDSSTLLYLLKDKGHEVEALAFDYGQRHRVELERAEEISRKLGIAFQLVSIEPIGKLIAGKSSQLNLEVAVPEGHYESKSMKTTVVPNRNMIFLSIAVGRAIALGFSNVAFGAHSGDHAIYPDCRQDFSKTLAKAVELCDWKKINLISPFVQFKKWEIVLLGSTLGVPFERTWSCYKGGTRHCGRCGTCVERREAFSLAGVTDPTEYENE